MKFRKWYDRNKRRNMYESGTMSLHYFIKRMVDELHTHLDIQRKKQAIKWMQSTQDRIVLCHQYLNLITNLDKECFDSSGKKFISIKEKTFNQLIHMTKMCGAEFTYALTFNR